MNSTLFSYYDKSSLDDDPWRELEVEISSPVFQLEGSLPHPDTPQLNEELDRSTAEYDMKNWDAVETNEEPDLCGSQSESGSEYWDSDETNEELDPFTPQSDSYLEDWDNPDRPLPSIEPRDEEWHAQNALFEEAYPDGYSYFKGSHAFKYTEIPSNMNPATIRAYEAREYWRDATELTRINGMPFLKQNKSGEIQQRKPISPNSPTWCCGADTKCEKHLENWIDEDHEELDDDAIGYPD